MLQYGHIFNAAATDPEANRERINLAIGGYDGLVSSASESKAEGGGNAKKDKDVDFAANVIMITEAARLQQESMQALNLRLDAAEKALDIAEVDLLIQRENLLQAAYRLDNDTAVFFDDDGNGYDEQGNKISEARLQDLSKNDRKEFPTYKDWEANRLRLQDNRESKEEITAIREKAANDDLASDDLDELGQDVDSIVAKGTQGSLAAQQAYRSDIGNPQGFDKAQAAIQKDDIDDLGANIDQVLKQDIPAVSKTPNLSGLSV